MMQLKEGGWVQNVFFLGISLFVIGSIINFVLFYAFLFSGIDLNSISDIISFFAAASLVSYVYTKSVGEIMSKGLRIKVTGLAIGLYFIYQILITIPVLPEMISNPTILVLFLGLLFALMAFSGT